MARFEELQELWQGQPQPAAVVDWRGMTDALRRLGRRQYLMYAFKVAAVVWQTWFCLSRLGLSVLTVVGQALLLAGAARILLTDWRTQSGIARLDFTKPSAGFVESVLERLRDPHASFRQVFWRNMILIGAGINLLYGAGCSGKSLEFRIPAHLGISAASLAACWLGLKVRSMRYAADYRPLVQRLAAMKKALEEQSQ